MTCNLYLLRAILSFNSKTPTNTRWGHIWQSKTEEQPFLQCLSQVIALYCFHNLIPHLNKYTNRTYTSKCLIVITYTPTLLSIFRGTSIFGKNLKKVLRDSCSAGTPSGWEWPHLLPHMAERPLFATSSEPQGEGSLIGWNELLSVQAMQTRFCVNDDYIEYVPALHSYFRLWTWKRSSVLHPR